MKKHRSGWLIVGVMCAACGPQLCASQVDDELARYLDASGKAERTYQEGLTRERTRALTTLTAAAKRSAKSEPESADALWKLVLQLDDANAEAREHFTANGKLASVLKSLGARQGPLLGDQQVAAKKAEPKIDMTGAKPIRITASYNSGYTVGSFKAGTVLIFQYVSGTWSGENLQAVAEKNQSPDDEKSAVGNRLEMFIDSGNEPVVLATVPAGTAAKPFIYTLERDVVGLSLRIANRRGVRVVNQGGGSGRQQMESSYTGDVKYLVRIVR